MRSDGTLDCVGLMCPMPIVQLSKRMKALPRGKVLAMRADDPGVAVDAPAWCNRTGNTLLGQEQEGKVSASYIRDTAP